MVREHALSAPDAVAAALGHPHLVPPPPPPDIGAGPTAELRAAMARFRGGDGHVEPRRAVERAIARLDPDELAAVAADHVRRLAEEGLADEELLDLAARRVPVSTLAVALGCGRDDLGQLAEEVEAVVAVIGRGGPASAASDAAARSLLDRFADHPDGPVAAVSLLYQVFDATAALIRTTLAHGSSTDPATSPVPSALPGTVRVAVEPTTIEGRAIDAGEVIRLRFTDAGQQFGAGPHACPGADAARAIAAAVVSVVGGADRP